ncbi:MAG: hypothetical protein KGI06_02555 [Candidatus Micrarchaeota archaeon]|nr:hypothetical protein [Candidatus Micrarchaeota archaeon]
MQSVNIPRERARKLRGHKELVDKIEKLCGCSIGFGDDDIIEITGAAFAEYSARNIVYAFGRGFECDIACKLHDNEYYFNSIDLAQLISSDKRIKQVKARIIGESGKTKRYIEGVSSAKLSVYGDTVSFIGTIEEINEAETAVNTLIEGGTHRLAYARMEAAHRKNKVAAKKAGF